MGALIMKERSAGDNNHSRCQFILRKIDRTLEKMSFKLRDNLVVVGLLARNTLTVVVMFLIVFSLYIILPFLMGHPPPCCYIAYAIWISLIFGTCIVVAIIGYMRISGSREVEK